MINTTISLETSTCFLKDVCLTKLEIGLLCYVMLCYVYNVLLLGCTILCYVLLCIHIYLLYSQGRSNDSINQ